MICFSTFAPGKERNQLDATIAVQVLTLDGRPCHHPHLDGRRVQQET